MGAKKSKPDLMDVSFDLKFTAKQMEKESKKVEREEGKERKKILDVFKPKLILFRP
jgi:hypothetical protein